MFRSSTILRELVGHAATSLHDIQGHNFTECFDRNITLARLSTSSLRMVEDRNV